MRLQENGFSVAAFQAPGKEYAPIYSWVWNGPLTEEKIDAQIGEMRRLGIRAFYIIPEPQSFRPAIMPTRMDPNYLTPEYFRYYRYAMDRAREYGMECWLYDEGGWPSGGACGRVLFEYPEYAKRNLRYYTRLYKAGERYCAAGEDSAAFIDGRMIEDGYAFDGDTEVTVYESGVFAWEAPGIPDYPDLTMQEATQAFIRITHEQYKEHLGAHFGDTMTAVFTDEPKAPNLPFRAEMCRMYEEQYGESILPHLPVIAGTVPLNEGNIEYRRRWYDLCSRMYCENFLMECKKWANANGMKFTGHLDKDDHPMGCIQGGGNFQVMRGLRCMDLPGVDVIWRQIFPGERKQIYIGGNAAGMEAENRFFPRYASSAAAQTGNDLAMTESFGVYGYGITYEQMRFVLGFQAIRGVTVVNMMVFSYDREGYTMSQEAPGFSEIQGCHRDLGEFNRYIERLAYVCSRGRRVCDTALYYPINDIWGGLYGQKIAEAYEALGHAMEARGIDFDILDDDVILQEKEIDGGVVRMGKAQYSKIAIPAGAFLSAEVKARLERFCAGGGVIVTDADMISPEVEIIGGDGRIRVMKREINGRDFICLFNEDKSSKSFSVQIGESSGYYVDVTLGELRTLAAEENGSVRMTLEGGETCALYLTDEVLKTAELPACEKSVRLDGTYAFRRAERFVIGERRLEYEELSEESVCGELGEWSDITGRDFTGSCVYTTNFRSPGCNAVLDLGDVRHSCEVFINGQSLGVRVMKPYRFIIAAEAMREENTLEIRVSNTPGNQHQYTKSFEKYKAWQLSVYKGAQDIFDRDSLESGLFGPVVLKHS